MHEMREQLAKQKQQIDALTKVLRGGADAEAKLDVGEASSSAAAARSSNARARSSRRVRIHSRNTHSTKRMAKDRLTASTIWSALERYTFCCSGGSWSKVRYSHPAAWLGAEGSAVAQGHCVEYADSPGSSGVKSWAKYRAHRELNVFACSSRNVLNRL